MPAAERTEWVQPIVVDKAGSHRATVKVAAVASVLAWLHHRHTDPEPWVSWLSGRFTKTVRRATTTKLDRVADTYGGVTVHLGASRATALAPVPYPDLPREVAKLQVSGTDLPRTVARPGRAPCAAHQCPVRVVVLEDLTTGKAAAQAAHALFAWALQADAGDLATWHRHPLTVSVDFSPAGQLVDLAAVPGAVVIRDAGLTEIVANTLTAVALPTGPAGS